MVYKFESTTNYVENVKNYVKKTYGEIKPVWMTLIELLGSHYDLYQLAQIDIESSGLITNGDKGPKANPSIKIANDALIQIQKLVNELGISPKQEIRLRTNDPSEADDDFLETLTK